MINPFHEVNWQPGPAEKRKFATSLAVGFPCVAVALLCLKRILSGTWAVELALWIGGVGLGLGLLLLAIPVMARPFYVVWYGVACSIGIVVSNVLFAAFYLLVLTPIGLVLRAVGRSPLRKGSDKNAATYWREAEHVSDPKRYFGQF
jgi:hypothetical protein